MKDARVKSMLGFFAKYSVAVLCIGVAMMSIGVYLVGTHVPYGNVLLTVASAIVYLSIIFIAVMA
jgi:hypothetical protein